MQTCETTNRNHIEGLEGRGKLAQDSKAHRFGAQGKWGVCARRVRVLTWGDLRSMAVWLMMVDNGFLVVPDPKRPGAEIVLPDPERAKRQRPIRPHSAPCRDASRETAEVSRRHSSGSVLHESGRPRRAEHAKQSGAMGDSILDVQARPGQSSSA